MPGLITLTIDALHGLTDLVEDVHKKAAGIPAAAKTGGIPGLVYGSIHGVISLVGALDDPLSAIIPDLEPHSPTPKRAALLAALNGVLGDALADHGSSLAIPMTVRQNGHAIQLDAPSLARAFPQPGRKLLVLVHGLCKNDLQWRVADQDFGQALAADLGYTSLYLHYNTGLHVSANGCAFSDQLADLLENWPAPVDELVILAHSMGGLVARSACHYAAAQGLAWPEKLKKIVFLGTPHHGSPLERGGQWLHNLLDITDYTAPFGRLGKIRSAGITDLRHGSLLDEDWHTKDRFAHAPHHRPAPVPLPEGVECYTVAAVLGSSPLHALLGDGLVPLDSALGKHPDPSRSLAFPADHRWIALPLNHQGLLASPEVYDRIRAWLA